MIGHISWVGIFDYLGMAAFALTLLAAALMLWWEGREDEREAELIDLVERMRRSEGHL